MGGPSPGAGAGCYPPPGPGGPGHLGHPGRPLPMGGLGHGPTPPSTPRGLPVLVRVLLTHPFAASHPLWAAKDIKSARGNITLYSVGRFNKSDTKVATAKPTTEAAEWAAGRDGAPVRPPTEWWIAGPCQTAAKAA